MIPWEQILYSVVKAAIALGVAFVLGFKMLQGLEIDSEFLVIAMAVLLYYFTDKKNESRRCPYGN